MNNGIPVGFGLSSGGIGPNGLTILGNQSHRLQNINLTAQQVALNGLSGARLQLGLPIMNERGGSNTIPQQNKLQISDYLNAYRTSNQRPTSNQMFGSSTGITVPTPAEVAMMAEIERLREQNNAHIMSLVRSGLISSTSPPVSIDSTPSGANRANSHNIADFISRVNASAASPPPLLANIAMACLNRYSGSPNLAALSDTSASQASRFNKSS